MAWQALTGHTPYEVELAAAAITIVMEAVKLLATHLSSMHLFVVATCVVLLYTRWFKSVKTPTVRQPATLHPTAPCACTSTPIL